MKIPNILTIGRILIAPILVIVFYFPGELSDWLSCAIFVIAAFTDYLDGFFARLYKQQSKFGELLDPIADKVLVATALALLIMSQTIKGPHVVAAIIIIKRSKLIIMYCYFSYKDYETKRTDLQSFHIELIERILLLNLHLIKLRE